MNALLTVLKQRKTVVLANDGRLLKKSFFGLLILTLAFQSGEFGRNYPKFYDRCVFASFCFLLDLLYLFLLD